MKNTKYLKIKDDRQKVSEGYYLESPGKKGFLDLVHNDNRYMIIGKDSDGKVSIPSQTDKVARLYAKAFKDLDGKDTVTYSELKSRMATVFVPQKGSGVTFELLDDPDEEKEGFEFIDDSDDEMPFYVILENETFEDLNGKDVNVKLEQDDELVTVTIENEEGSGYVRFTYDEDFNLTNYDNSANAENVMGRSILSDLLGFDNLEYLRSYVVSLYEMPEFYSTKINDSFKRRENVTIELPSGEKLTGLYDEEHKGKHLVMVGEKTYSVDGDHIWKMEREKKKRLIPVELKEKIEKRLSEIEKSIKSSDEKEVKRLEKERDRLNAQLSKYRMDSIKTNTDMSKVKDGKEFRVRVDSIKKLLGIKDSIKEIKDEVFFEDNLEKAWKEKYKDSTLSFSYSPKELRVRSKNPAAEVRICKEMWSVKDYDTLDTESQELAQMVEAAANNTTNTRGKFKDIKDDSGEEQYDRGVEAGKQGLEKGWTKYETIHYYEELHKQFMEGLEKGFERVEDSEDTVKVGDIIPLNLNGNKSEVVVLKVASKDKVLGGEDSHHFVNFYERKEGKWLPSEVEVESKDVESEDFGDYCVFYDESEEGYLWDKK